MNRARIALLVAAGLLGACRSPDPPPEPPEPEPASKPPTLRGSGATFPGRLYREWVRRFGSHVTTWPGGVPFSVEYELISSGAGIREWLTGKTDFAASDNALSDEERAYVKDDLVAIPATAGAVAMAFNVPGRGELRLNGKALADIFTCRITRWNDPAIAALNPGALPDLPIVPVHRLDTSGTTFVFLQHLASLSPGSGISVGRTASWPCGEGAFGNEGIGARVKLTEGAIGYMDYGTARLLKLTMTALENREGNFVAPSSRSAAASLDAFVHADDPAARTAAPDGYPLTTYSWILTHRRQPSRLTAERLQLFLRYALSEGQTVGEALGYVPLPPRIAAEALASVENITGP